jgi:hypothetical protein
MPKRPKNPKSMRTALKYGWTKVTVKRQENTSWLGILIQIDRMVKGRYISRYSNDGGGFCAFENESDASMIALKFGVW